MKPRDKREFVGPLKSNMQLSNQSELQSRIDTRLRIIRTLWFALLVSIGLYYALILFLGPPFASPNRSLSITLAAAGLMFVLISMLLKQRYLKQSVDQQSIAQVQVAYVLACALCEVPALLGLLDFFVAGNRRFFVLFIIAAGGMLLNFPRRQHVLDACYQSQPS